MLQPFSQDPLIDKQVQGCNGVTTQRAPENSQSGITPADCQTEDHDSQHPHGQFPKERREDFGAVVGVENKGHGQDRCGKGTENARPTVSDMGGTGGDGDNDQSG